MLTFDVDEDNEGGDVFVVYSPFSMRNFPIFCMMPSRSRVKSLIFKKIKIKVPSTKLQGKESVFNP